MTPDEAVAVIRAYHTAIDRLDFEAIAGFFADDAVYISGGVGGTMRGRGAILAAFRSYFDEYPDQVSVDDSIKALSSSEVRSIWRLTATSTRTAITSVRSGEEIATLDLSGKIVRIVVSDS
jgi:uncharacterized protein (TIGR02246 family)